MLYTISRGNVSCDGGQSSIVHLVSTIQLVRKNAHAFVFSDGHGIMTLTDFYDDLGELDKVDWNVMQSRYWNDTQEDNDRMRRRQAEFLVQDYFPWDLVHEIGVMNNALRRRVEQVTQSLAHQPNVNVHQDWYY